MNSILTLAVLFCLFGSSAAADAPVCAGLVSPGPRPDRIIVSSAARLNVPKSLDYSKIKRALFLGDGGAMPFPARPTPEQLFVYTDISVTWNTMVRLDNNKLPFKDDSFEFVGLYRGLCLCESIKVSCGGIAARLSAMEKFLEDVIRVLDKKNPESLALMTGFYFPGEKHLDVPRLWADVLQEAAERHPNFQFARLSEPRSANTDGFVGIAVAPGRSIPLKELLRRLDPKLARD